MELRAVTGELDRWLERSDSRNRCYDHGEPAAWLGGVMRVAAAASELSAETGPFEAPRHGRARALGSRLRDAAIATG